MSGLSKLFRGSPVSLVIGGPQGWTRNPAFSPINIKSWIPGSVRKQRGRPRNDDKEWWMRPLRNDDEGNGAAACPE